MTKRRVALYLSPETERALAEYTQAHGDRFESISQAGEHLLSEVLLGRTDESTHVTMAPKIEKVLLDQRMESIGRYARPADPHDPDSTSAH